MNDVTKKNSASDNDSPSHSLGRFGRPYGRRAQRTLRTPQFSIWYGNFTSLLRRNTRFIHEWRRFFRFAMRMA